MQHNKTRIRRLAYIAALALAALAAFPTGAVAGSGTSDAEYRALMIRSAALNRIGVGDSRATPLAEKFVPGVTDFPSRLGEGTESTTALQEEFVPGVTDFPSALGRSGERAAEDRLAELGRQAMPVYVQPKETGFDWSAAAAGGIAATLLLLTTALVVLIARRSRVAVS
jgi:hypothetical protein